MGTENVAPTGIRTWTVQSLVSHYTDCAILPPTPLYKKQGEHKIVILEDSHTWSLVGRLRDNLTDKFEIIGYTKPNSNIVAQV